MKSRPKTKPLGRDNTHGQPMPLIKCDPDNLDRRTVCGMEFMVHPYGECINMPVAPPPPDDPHIDECPDLPLDSSGSIDMLAIARDSIRRANAEVDDHLAAGRWHDALRRHAKRCQWPALAEMVRRYDAKITDDDYWSLFRDAWTMSENCWQHLPPVGSVIPDLLGVDRDRAALMDAREWARLRALPTKVDVFRGCSAGLNESGMSWTLEEEIARRFALHHQTTVTAPTIIHGLVPREDIRFLLHGREEAEVVVMPGAVQIVLRDRLPVDEASAYFQSEMESL